MNMLLLPMLLLLSSIIAVIALDHTESDKSGCRARNMTVVFIMDCIHAILVITDPPTPPKTLKTRVFLRDRLRERWACHSVRKELTNVGMEMWKEAG